MAEVLKIIAYLAVGIAIGWWIKRRFFAPVYAATDMARLSREWKDHLDAHAKSLEGSVALTAAGAQADTLCRLMSEIDNK